MMKSALSALGFYRHDLRRRLWVERHLELGKPDRQLECDVMTEFFQEVLAKSVLGCGYHNQRIRSFGHMARYISRFEGVGMREHMCILNNGWPLYLCVKETVTASLTWCGGQRLPYTHLRRLSD